MNTKNSILSLYLAIFAALYLFLIFPFAYFRHDDWIIIGNGVLQLPKNWMFAFQPTLIIDGIEDVWFYRPFFKILAYVFYSLFGFHYYLWLAVTLLCTLCALYFGSKAIQSITGSSRHGTSFILFFCASVHLHFGSQVWIGEGLMNCPMIMLLMVNAYFFFESIATNRSYRNHIQPWIALICFVLALGFKEAAVFHSGLLFLVLFIEPSFSEMPWTLRLKKLGPYILISIVYLSYRLLILPVNPGYVPSFTYAEIRYSILMLSGAFLLPVLLTLTILFLTERTSFQSFAKEIFKRWLYILFFAVICFPYLGHPFFSPGWLFAPGFYLSFILVLFLMKFNLSQRTQMFCGLVLLFITSIPVGWRLNQLGWRQWYKAQREVLEILNAQKGLDITEVVIRECSIETNLTLDRVVASSSGLSEIWELTHGNRIPIRVVTCTAPFPPALTTGKRLEMEWRFPKLKVLR